MALPKLDIPIYETTLPSGTKVSFRPFLVKEEKILLMAAQAKDDANTIKAIIQILTNCVIDKINITDLPVFDVEYLFLQLRARSVGEVVDLRYQCNKKDESDKVCGFSSEYKVNLLDIKPTTFDASDNIVKLTDTVGVTLRPPRFSLMTKLNTAKENNTSVIVEAIIDDCIESVYDKDTVHYIKDVTKEDLRQFVDSLNTTQERKIQEYFSKLPKITYTLDFHCPKCQHKEQVVLEGLSNFFE